MTEAEDVWPDFVAPATSLLTPEEYVVAVFTQFRPNEAALLAWRDVDRRWIVELINKDTGKWRLCHLGTVPVEHMDLLTKVLAVSRTLGCDRW